MLIKKIRQFKENVAPKGSFAANAATMLAGTGIAQSIYLVCLPILTRQYSPSDFGVFSLYMAIVSIAEVFTTVRYEFAIMLPEKDDDAIKIIILNFAITTIVSLFSLVLILIFARFFASYLKISNSYWWLYLIPLGIFLLGIYRSFNYWLIRKKMFRKLSFRKVIQSLVMTAFQMIVGFLSFGPIGLILGYIFGQLAGYSFLVWQVWKDENDKIRKVNFQGAMHQAIRYRNFVFYSFPSNLINVVANEIPNVLLNRFFGAITVGFYSLPIKILNAPAALLAQSVFDVFKERASSDYRKSGNCLGIYKKTFRSLVFLSIIPFVLFFFLSPLLIPLLLGQQWKVAGIYAQILSVSIFFSFISGPLNYVYFVAQKQKYELILQILFLFSTISSIFIGAKLNDPKLSIILISSSFSFLCIISLVFSFYFAHGKDKSN